MPRSLPLGPVAGPAADAVDHADAPTTLATTAPATLAGRVSVYDPAMCCQTGVCGPGVNPALLGITRALRWLEKAGVTVERYEVYYMEFSIDHHLAGIVMAQLCVERAIHAELRQLCQESIASQQRQIELYRTWLREWYGIEYTGEIEQSAEQDIRRLSELYGAEFEDLFLTEFSKHHLRIIKESEKAVRKVYHEELRREAQMTITNQSRQVVQMQTWDCQWYGDCRQGLINQVQH